MKFECKSDVFIKTIQQVGKARSKNQKETTLADISLSLQDHLLTIKATNLELFCEKSIPVKGLVNGTCLIQGERFLKIISTFTAKDVTFICEVIEGVLSITTEKGVMEIKTSPQEEFPNLPPQGEQIGSIKKDSFLSLIKEVSFCSSKTDIKPEISSIFIYTRDEFIYSVATDSYRLAEKKINNDNNLEFSILIPEKHIADITQIIQEENEDITLYKQGSMISLCTSNTTLAVQTISGSFPDYKQLFPKEFTTVITLSKEELQKGLLLTTFFNDMYSQVEIIISENSCVLHSHNDKVGQVTHSFPVTNKGENIDVKYNNRFFLETLPYLEGDVITCSFTTPQRPVFIQSLNDTSFTYLLMPLNR
ncbi:MAG: hypothetical protein RI935_179 [Candidatus Parcubacteria bacterium]|jgi:DNA polymerase-3 subunit beta